MGINFGAALKGFADHIREETKEDKKINRVLVSNTLDKYTTNYYDKKKTHDKENKIIETTANYVLQHIKDPVLAVQIANMGQAGLVEFKKNLEIATEQGIDINVMYGSLYEPSEELKSLKSVNEIIKATRPFQAPAIPKIGGRQTLFAANPNDTIKTALKDVVGLNDSNKIPLVLGQAKVKKIPEIKSNINQALLNVNIRIGNFLDQNGGDASKLTGEIKKEYDDMVKQRDTITSTYRNLEKIKSEFDAPTSPYSKVSAIRTFQFNIAASISNSKLYKMSVDGVVNNMKNDTRNKYIVGAHSAIEATAKTYNDTQMGKVLDSQFQILNGQVKEHITLARQANANLPANQKPPAHYEIVTVTPDRLNRGVRLTSKGEVPIKAGTIIRLEGTQTYVLYTGQGSKGYLTGNTKQPRIETTQ